MSGFEFLNALKDKVLDAKNIEIIKHAYELQNENIKQLRGNNEALKENNELLKEKNNSLEKEVKALRQRLATIEAELRVKGEKDSPHKLSEFAEAILRKCIENDVTDFVDEDMISNLPYSRMQVESGLDELSSLDLIAIGSVSVMGSGTSYYLTSKGKTVALKISSKKS